MWLGLLVGAQAPSTAVQSHIDRGKELIDKLEYEAAVDELVIAADSPDASPEQRVEANLYAGIANRVLGKDVDAKLNFVFVLKNDPTARLPEGTAPKINNFFELVRQEVELTRVRPAPPPAPVPEEGLGVLVWLGGAVLGVGTVGAVLAAAAAGGGEFALGVHAVPGRAKELATWAVWGGAAAVVVALVVGGAGGTMLLWGVVE